MQPVKIILLGILIFSGTSCKKYLETKSNQSLSTISSLKDLRELLDGDFGKKGPKLAQTASDEYWIPSFYWDTRVTETKLAYVWDAQVNPLSDWRTQYLSILTFNTVLDNLQHLDLPKGTEYNSLKGEALFLRDQSFYQLAQIYAPQYDANSAANDLGIVLRLDADFNKPSKRSSVKETYERIIKDLLEAAELLPASISTNTRPNKPAAYALLARTYLQIGDYANAKIAADNCLNLYNTLMDYNDQSEVDTLSSDPFKHPNKDHKEILYFLNEDASPTMSSNSTIDSGLYALYLPNDLRRSTFFRSGSYGMRFKGSYNSSLSLGNFIGLSTSEVYLVRAESLARLGDKDAAMQNLNTLLRKRYKTGTFTDLTAATATQALDIILTERRKEMVLRGMRWADLKRLNKEPARAVAIKRDLTGQIYTLFPNDLKYAFLVPTEVIQLSDLQQNPR